MYSQIYSLFVSYFHSPETWLSNISWRFPQTISDLEVVFIVGAPRSGTTLMQKIIGSHKDFCSIHGETGLFSSQNIFDINRSHFYMSEYEQKELFSSCNDVIDFFQEGVRKVIQQQEGKVFVEKTPQHILKINFLLKHFSKARFVHIVRDGRDAYCSAHKHPGVPQGQRLSTYAKYWRKCIRSYLSASHSSRIYNLKYEDFVENPKAELQALMKFLCVDVQDEQLDPHIYGKDKRADLVYFNKLKSSISNSSVGNWKVQLSSEECYAFIRLAGRELKLMGYKE